MSAKKYVLPTTTSKVKETYQFFGPKVFRATMLLGQALVVSCVLYTAWKTHEIGCEMGIHSNFPCHVSNNDVTIALPEVTENVMTDTVVAALNETAVVALNETVVVALNETVDSEVVTAPPTVVNTTA